MNRHLLPPLLSIPCISGAFS